MVLSELLTLTLTECSVKAGQITHLLNAHAVFVKVAMLGIICRGHTTLNVERGELIPIDLRFDQDKIWGMGTARR